ncbi:glycosyltransferase [Patescibacteria group bacterium]|nr:glycosyltransferase [Patescibacteria group bacterium]
MKIALVHDYLSEFGGAERVLLALSELWPEAPIYTAFYSKGSSAWKRFKDRDIRVSWFHFLPFCSRLASPLRFLAPFVWGSFNFSSYDVVISSANWYITKGLKKGSSLTSPSTTGSEQARTIEICYCHTPPRYLYGYPTAVEWRRYWPVRVYGELVGHFLRMYDFSAAQRVDWFVANSKNVAARIQKFYRRDSTVIYPPVDISVQRLASSVQGKRDYYLVVSRIVGGKGLELAIKACNRLRRPLKVVGKPAGWGSAGRRLRQLAGNTIEFLDEVPDEELAELYAGAKAFLATAEDEDFGMTPVEAMAAGTPVVAFRGGGYVESVIDPSTSSGQATGVFFDELTIESLVSAIKRLERISISPQACRRQAKKFSKARFHKEMKAFVEQCVYEMRNS